MSLYLGIKYLHVACVLLSGLGFFLRGILALGNSPLMQTRLARLGPHLNDSVLLAAAITLATMSGQYPFVVSWVTAKVFALVVYIILGSLALKPGRPKPVRIVCWLAALLTFTYIVSVARTRDPFGFLAPILA